MSVHKESLSHEKQLVALGRVLQTLREEERIDVLIQSALSYLDAEFNYAVVWIGLYERLGHYLLGHGGVIPNGDSKFLQQQLTLKPGDLLEQVVIQQRPLGVPDLREEPRAGEWRKVAQKSNIQGTIIFPIRYKDRCMGVALLGSELWGVSPQSEEKARLSMLLGELAVSLYRNETDRQRQQTKQPAQPLFHLLTRLRSLPTLEHRLEAIAAETHQFIQPDRTNIYWFEPSRHYFWQRISQPQARSDARGNPVPPPEIVVQEVNSFYQALSADQLVSIGEADSSLKTGMMGRLMNRLHAQSLLAAPILFRDELLGFISAEGESGRIWSAEEKDYMRGAGQLIALTAPTDDPEAAIQQIRLDQSLMSEVANAIYSEDDWLKTLEKCGEQVRQRLDAERFLVLTYDESHNNFTIRYQSQPVNRRPLTRALKQLNDVDRHMLERSSEAIGVENLEDNLKLMAWREDFLELDVRSLLVCSTSIGKPLEGLIVIGHEIPRTWTRAEREIVRAMSQQIGLILHQWQLQSEVKQQQQLYRAIQWGLTAMQQTHQLDQLEQASMQHISGLLDAPLAALVTWLPGRKTARIVAAAVTDNQFAIASDMGVSVHDDSLIQWALQTDGLFSINIDHLSVETRKWLSGSGIGQVLAIALRTAPEHESTGILLVADSLNRVWSDRQLNVLGMLTSQLAWSRRYLMLTESLTAQREELERLNWYKQRRIEEFYRALGAEVRRLNELSHQKDALASMRYHQILRQLGNMLTAVTPVLKHEQWQLYNEYETTPLVSLLKRSMERAEGLIKQRQLWSQVHNDQNLNIGGDIPKIEFVLYELLAAACRRSPTNGRLDIWCRPIDFHWIELSITDNGVIDQRLLEELHTGRSEDLLAPSALDHPPGLHLAICQSLMQQIGGEFNLYRLEDGRVLSRLILPIATGVPAPPLKKTPVRPQNFGA